MAVEEEDGTVVLAVGAKPGEAFTPSAWEVHFRANHLPPDEAVRLVAERDAAHPDDPGTLYNLACYRVRAGDHAAALKDFRRAFELDPETIRKWSAGDADLDPIRAEISAITG